MILSTMALSNPTVGEAVFFELIYPVGDVCYNVNTLIIKRSSQSNGRMYYLHI